MRSRYSAYASGDSQYLLDTWHPDTKPESLKINPKQKWLGLKIKATQAGSAYDNDGMVEFVARFKIDGSGHRLHERSNFTKVNGKWTYREGQLITKAGRKAS